MLCALLIAQYVLSVSPASAQTPWLSTEVGQLTLLYPLDYQAEVALFAGRQAEAVNAIYAQLSALYDETLETPVNVRLYSSRDQFARLNALAPRLGDDAFHAHLGAREIAIVAPFPADLFTSDEILNVLRHELNGLFLSRLSDGGLPPGLEVGFNQYVEFPSPQTRASRDKVEAALANNQLFPWSELLDGPWVYLDHEIAYPQSLSIAAFLVDTYGFGKLIEFARAVPDLGGYRAALAQVYGKPVDRLELDWLDYLPAYLETRWPVNVLFNYDLTPFEGALNQGAYAQVLRGLDYALPFLVATGQAEKVSQAEALYAIARQGVVAAEFVKAVRDAVLNGDYELALDLAAQARAAYQSLPETSRLAEVAAYEARAREGLALRVQLDAASQLAALGQFDATETGLLALASRLQAIGDADGAQRATTLLAGLRARRAAGARWAIYLALLAAALFLAHRAYEFFQDKSRKPMRVL